MINMLHIGGSLLRAFLCLKRGLILTDRLSRDIYVGGGSLPRSSSSAIHFIIDHYCMYQPRGCGHVTRVL